MDTDEPPIIDRTVEGKAPRIEVIRKEGKPNKCTNCERKPVERIEGKWYCEVCANLIRHYKVRISLHGDAQRTAMETAKANIEQGIGLLVTAGAALAGLFGEEAKPKRKRRKKRD